MRGISSFTDFFVICSGTSEPHLKAITGAITETLREKHGVQVHGTSGIPASQWVVIDYVDVLVHALHQDKREFYALDDLWGDAPTVNWDDEPAPPKAKATRKPAAAKTGAKTSGRTAAKARTPKKASS